LSVIVYTHVQIRSQINTGNSFFFFRALFKFKQIMVYLQTVRVMRLIAHPEKRASGVNRGYLTKYISFQFLINICIRSDKRHNGVLYERFPCIATAG